MIQLRPPRNLGALTLMRCSACDQGLRVSELPQGYRKGLRLSASVRLTLNEFLCPNCFVALPQSEQEEWLSLSQLVDR